MKNYFIAGVIYIGAVYALYGNTLLLSTAKYSKVMQKETLAKLKGVGKGYTLLPGQVN